MEFQKVIGGGCDSPPSPSLQLSNGYVLPQGTLTPNTLFVGGIALKVDADEIRDFFLRFGAIRDVKIISHKGGICKGYGFVYFSEEVDIQTIVEQQVSFKGRKLKLGPAIMKVRNSYYGFDHVAPRPAPWASPTPYVYCTYCAQGLSVPHALPWIGGGNPYTQPYTYPCGPGGYMFPQMPAAYTPNAYPYPYAPPLWDGGDHSTQPINRGPVDCGVQTLLTAV